MPGIPTHFVALEQVIARFSAAADPQLNAIAQTMKNQPGYAYLGSVGPAIGDFLPSDPPAIQGAPGGTQYFRIWNALFGVVGGDGTPADPGLFAILKNMNDFLDQVTTIANAEDMDALEGFQGQINVINQTAAQLGDLVQNIPSVAVGIASSIGTGMKPAVDAPVGNPVPPPEVWSVRDFLSWKKPGVFSKALLDRARGSGDERFLAYAYGYLISYITKACGSPFVNSIVLGPYRTQWWRHRWVNNWVDAWVYGKYTSGATMSGDTPAPPYDDPAWKNLCNASLHERLGKNLPAIDPVDTMTRLRSPQQPFPDILPAEFGEFWVNAFSDAYGPPAPGSPVKAEALNGAFVMTWMVLWFQTSGSALGCNPTPPLAPPDGCGDTPPWTDPTVPGDNGSGSPPPSPEVDTGVDTGKVVSAILLIILGGLSVLTGGLIDGAAEIAGGIDLLEHAGTVNWGKLRCDLYWYRLYLYNGLKALHDILSLGGFVYPYARELANDSTALSLLGTDFRYDSGIKLCKSNSRREGFPAQPWDGALATWTMAPGTWESPQTVAYLATEYPSFFIDDPANPLGAGRVLQGAAWPPGYAVQPGTQIPVEFGNLVENAVDVFSHLAVDYPNWNLDADRGMAWLTWQFTAVYSDPVVIEPEP
uniref:Putative transmembrane protein n=1 Tax=Solibacter usitatus (strain Ellin6076) TaxID=234267 RepID=Q01Z10_SOLUE